MKVCGVHQVWISALCVQTQRMMCTTQSSKSGVLVVHCDLLVVRVVPIVVCDDAVVHHTLVLITFIVNLCFRRGHFAHDFAVLEENSLHHPSVTVNCCWLLPNFYTFTGSRRWAASWTASNAVVSATRHFAFK